MKLKIDKYPIFEVNQVLTSDQLNNAFNHLDEQERLTRANLIGIGIVCGLKIKLASTTIHLSKGCGITSEGYLVVEPDDVALVSFRKLGNKLDYEPFKVLQHDLYEIFPQEELGINLLNNKILQDKAVLLFLELKQDSLRNCVPNNCNDKVQEVTARVRRLLINKQDLAKVIANSNKLGTDLAASDLKDALLKRLNLPDLRLPRYEIAGGGFIPSDEVLHGFLRVFQKNKLVDATNKALMAAYEAFKPLLQEFYKQNPFSNSEPAFNEKFGFLDADADSIPARQVKFVQYYYDFFDDLFRAYDEFRWKGAELMCSCCPPEELFPRHLMLGALFPDAASDSIYRHSFLPTSAIGGCEDRTQELVQLFRRLVEMIEQFTDTPIHSINNENIVIPDEQIRITPSKLGDVFLSEKAIPYYYLKNNKPKLYEDWDVRKTRQHRSKQNLSYHAKDYAADIFVKEPLRYDLENYNFLRIEGHLGKLYQSVMSTLLSLKTECHLPVEVIALRTGKFDENIMLDLSKEDCLFRDLEAKYGLLKANLICSLCKEIQCIYNLHYSIRSVTNQDKPKKPKLPLLKQCAPEFLVKSGTLGEAFEKWLSQCPDGVIPNADANPASVYLDLQHSPESFQLIFYIIIYASKLFDQITQDLAQLNFNNFERQYKALLVLIEKVRLQNISPSGTEGVINLPDCGNLIDHLEAIVSSCNLLVFKNLKKEYTLRIKEIKQKQFLSNFLLHHPGVQHKAGVPLGGTFIIVYHHEPEQEITTADPSGRAGVNSDTDRNYIDERLIETVTESIAKQRAAKNGALDSKAIEELCQELHLQVSKMDVTSQKSEMSSNFADKAINAANSVYDFAPGEVIADFYLPYLCCTDCGSVQFVLPKTPPVVTTQISCTDPDTRQTRVTLKIKSGMGPYCYNLRKLDETQCQRSEAQCFEPIIDTAFMAHPGKYLLVIRDSTGAESVPQYITVPEPLKIIYFEENKTYSDDWENKTYQVKFKISGGTLPYKAYPPGRIIKMEDKDKYLYISPPVNSRKFTAALTDSANCVISSKEFNHTPCIYPCNGIAVRCGNLFGLPKPRQNRQYETFNSTIERLKVKINNTWVAVSDQKMKSITQPSVDDLNRDFEAAINNWIDQINQAIASAIDEMDDSYGSKLKRWLNNAIPGNDAARPAWFSLGYRDELENKPGALIIEHFSCNGFNEFDCMFKYEYSYSGINEIRTIKYTHYGTKVFLGNQKSIESKPFDCEECNKCMKEGKWVSKCDDQKIQANITQEFRGSQLILSASVEGNNEDEIEQYLWEVEGVTPSLFTGNEISTAAGATHVRLTVVTKAGCSSSVSEIISPQAQ